MEDIKNEEIDEKDEKQDKVIVHSFISVEQKDDIDFLADYFGLSKSAIIRIAVAEYIMKYPVNEWRRKKNLREKS